VSTLELGSCKLPAATHGTIARSDRPPFTPAPLTSSVVSAASPPPPRQLARSRAASAPPTHCIGVCARF
jgi:hypothetical protein